MHAGIPTADDALRRLIDPLLARVGADDEALDRWFSAAPQASLCDALVSAEVLIPNAPQTLAMCAKGYLQLSSLTALITPRGPEQLKTILTPRPALAAAAPAAAPPAAPAGPAPAARLTRPRPSADEATRHAPPRRSAPIEVGDSIGKCLITERVGRGSTSLVFKAFHTTLRCQVAIKLLAAEDPAELAELRRFVRREAQVLASLSHPAILRVLDCDEHFGQPYLVLEYVEGVSFAELLDQSGPMRPSSALRIALQAAEGLAHAAARGVTHRDVKPANILVARDGSVRVVDLGLAKVLHDRASALAGQSVGTPAYVAPEQVMGATDVDHRADIYALGGTLFEALSGQRPFSGEDAMRVMLAHINDARPRIDALIPDLPPALVNLVEDMLARDRDARPATWDEVVTRLRAVRELLRGERARPSPSDSTRRSSTFWQVLGGLLGGPR